MKTVFCLLALLPAAIVASPVIMESGQVAEANVVVTKRGFGCTGPIHNSQICDDHCKKDGNQGGYCEAWTGWFRCDCYNN